MGLLGIGIGLILLIALLMGRTETSQAATPADRVASQTPNTTERTQLTNTQSISETIHQRKPNPQTLDWNIAPTPTVETANHRTETTASPLTVELADGVPLQILSSELPVTATTLGGITALNNITVYSATATVPADSAALRFDFVATGALSAPVYQYTFAAATRFDQIDLSIASSEITELWQRTDEADNSSTPFTQVAVLTTTRPAINMMLGDAGTNVVGYDSVDEVVAAAWRDNTTLVLLPFDRLMPRLAVLQVDGQTPVENSNHFDAASYSLVVPIYAHSVDIDAQTASPVDALLAQLPAGNRNPQKLTVIAMTGVTAMVRLTAAEMDQRGNDWPAAVVGPMLASADITAISNEVPFVPGCQTDTRASNLTFCSKPAYMDALTASGVDIIGLTGNHQNDYGRTDAVTSLEIYEAAGLPVYGGGRNENEAEAPLYLEHNGNRLAFLGANSYGPNFAWATATEPGSARFDLASMSATIRNIKQLDRAEVVLVELQYQETYEVTPMVSQRQDFNGLVNAGADIVTGVQSHVPQAMEFTDGKLILYGLGNLFFDQMWSRSTREGLIVKHTIYDNRHISTQVFTTLLYDYGQPQWTTPEENSALLERVYGASYW